MDPEETMVGWTVEKRAGARLVRLTVEVDGQPTVIVLTFDEALHLSMALHHATTPPHEDPWVVQASYA